MSDKKKPGAPNIKDLKAKLGLKTPGGEAPAPPVMTPPPGFPGGDGIPAPPGVEPPAGFRPPPGVTPPPGIAPPAVTPPPGIAPPPTDLVAPPGFQAPAPAAPAPGEPYFASTPQHVDIDLDSVQGKKSRKIVWALVAAFASLVSMCGGYYFGDARLKKGWMAKSKKSCATTADVVKKLYNDTRQFEAVLEAEVDKTKKGAQPLAYYNPELFSKLSEVAERFDVNNANLKTILNKQIWTTHYRFVKEAGEVLPRLHTFLSLLAQLKSAVDVGRGVEAKYGAALKKKTRKHKEDTAKQPAFGVMIRGDKAGLFFALGSPVDKEGKKVKEHGSAEGYLLPNGKPGMFGKPPARPNECPEVNGTIRIFGADDGELNNRLKCRGQEDIVFEAWTIAIMQIKLILKQLEAVNPKDLYQKFQKSS